MSTDASTVRACRNTQEHDTEPCALPCPAPSEASTWPASSDRRECLTDPCGELSPLEIALALRQPPLPAEYYELVGLHLEDVAA
jgi:hypothetical protein